MAVVLANMWLAGVVIVGATALYAAFGDTAMVQRWGRWASDAFQGYLWEARGNAKGVAEAMRKADVSSI